MTLEEYRRQLGGSKRHQPKFKLRKPGEGEDNAQWKKTYLLKKDEEEEELEIEEIEVVSSTFFHSFCQSFLSAADLYPSMSQKSRLQVIFNLPVVCNSRL